MFHTIIVLRMVRKEKGIHERSNEKRDEQYHQTAEDSLSARVAGIIAKLFLLPQHSSAHGMRLLRRARTSRGYTIRVTAIFTLSTMPATGFRGFRHVHDNIVGVTVLLLLKLLFGAVVVSLLLFGRDDGHINGHCH